MGNIKMYLIAGLAGLSLLLLGVCGTAGAWYYRGVKADKEVEQVRQDLTALMLKERQLTDHWRTQAQTSYKDLMEKVSNIKVVNTTVNRNIQVEVERNPGFYSQPLPEGGRQAWLESRSVMQ